MGLSCHPSMPDYYVYQKDGKWFKTDVNLTERISARIFAHKELELPQIVFYPNWSAEGGSSAKYVAWRVNRNGEQVIRWYWRVGEHSKKCNSGRCVKIDDTRCAARVPAVIQWSAAAKRWVLSDLDSRATDEEANILDNLRR